MNWLHFIGKAYYPTPEAFAKEAETLGVNRRVSLRALGGFSWGDRVFLAFGDFTTKRRKTKPTPSIVFGYFDVDRVGGLSVETLNDLPEGAVEALWKPQGGRIPVGRGCGTYVVVATTRLLWGIPQLAEFLRDGDSPYPVKPSLGGTFVSLPASVEIRAGFRFGYTKILPERVEKLGCEGLLPYLRDDGLLPSLGVGEVVEDYHLNLWERTGF